jgi:surface polysaccharide O-acyltransferase-like enzyme
MRNATLDYARLLAAAGIVIFHSGAPGAAIGYAALPFFLMLLVCLAWARAERSSFAPFARDRLGRLLAPWLLWSAVYGALKLAEALVMGRDPATEFAPWMWLTGPAIHLWFLPYAAAVCLLLWPLARVARGRPAEVRAGLAILLAAAALAAVLVQAGLQGEAALPRPFAQWAFGAPGALFGLAAAVMPGGAGRAALLAGTAAALAAAGWPPGALQLVLAGAALWLCLALPLPDSAAARAAAGLALTVYLAHPLVAAVLTRGTDLPPASLPLALATLAVTLLLSAVLTAALAALHRPVARAPTAA